MRRQATSVSLILSSKSIAIWATMSTGKRPKMSAQNSSQRVSLVKTQSPIALVKAAKTGRTARAARAAKIRLKAIVQTRVRRIPRKVAGEIIMKAGLKARNSPLIVRRPIAITTTAITVTSIVIKAAGTLQALLAKPQRLAQPRSRKLSLGYPTYLRRHRKLKSLMSVVAMPQKP